MCRKRVHEVADTLGLAEFDIGWLVVADGTHRPSVFVSSQQLSKYERHEKGRRLAADSLAWSGYRIDSPADRINSAPRADGERERERG